VGRLRPDELADELERVEARDARKGHERHETAVERAWAIEYVKAMRELAPRYLFGFVDAKPLRSPQPAEQAAGYISKYLAKWREDGTLEVSESVKAAGRSLFNYVSSDLTRRSCTMRTLRISRLVWAWLNG
jgi:hypothetical protein